MVALRPRGGQKDDLIPGRQSSLMNISSGTSGPVSRHLGLAAIPIEDPYWKALAFTFLEENASIGTDSKMSITDRLRYVSVRRFSSLTRRYNNKVIPVTMILGRFDHLNWKA